MFKAYVCRLDMITLDMDQSQMNTFRRVHILYYFLYHESAGRGFNNNVSMSSCYIPAGTEFGPNSWFSNGKQRRYNGASLSVSERRLNSPVLEAVSILEWKTLTV